MQDKDIVNFLISFFDIKSNPFVINDLLDDIENLQNKENLISFVKQKIGYEKYKFLSGGLQKLTAMINDFKKENKLELSEEMQNKALTYSEDLFKRVTTICDEVNFELQTKGKKIDDLDLFATFKRNGLENHHIKVISSLGSKETVFTMAIHSKMELELKIASIVHKKAMIKSYPQLANKKSEDMKVLERLKNAN